MAIDWNTVRTKAAALDLERGDFLLFGSVPMLAHGLIPQVGDIDILARGRAWEQAASMGTMRRGASGDRVIDVAPDIEVFDGWQGMAVDRLFEHAETIDGIPVASLHAVLEFKRRLGRPKDATHIAILEAFLG